MEVYISGKIEYIRDTTGQVHISDQTCKKFDRAEKMLRARGYELCNPASEKMQRLLRYSLGMEKMKYGYDGDFFSFALVTNIVSIWRDCDAVYFLDDFTKSDSAMTEYSFAVATGKKLLFQDREDAQSYINSEVYIDWEEAWLPLEGDGDEEERKTPEHKFVVTAVSRLTGVRETVSSPMSLTTANNICESWKRRYGKTGQPVYRLLKVEPAEREDNLF